MTALAHTRLEAERLSNMGVETVLWDLTHPKPLDTGIENCDAVIHLAGTSPDDTRTNHCERLDLGGTKRLLDALSREKLQQFIYASSMAVYGDQHGECVNETIQPEPSTPHGISKRKTEAMLLKAHQVWDLPVVVLRFGLIYGPGGMFKRLVRQIDTVDAVFPPHVADAVLGLVSVHDAARACLHGLRSGKPGEVYLVADDHPMKAIEIMETTAQQMGLREPHTATGFLARWKSRHRTVPGLESSARPLNEKFKIGLGFKFDHPSLSEGLQSEAIHSRR